MRTAPAPVELTDTQRRVRDVLFAWDPIGVRGISEKWPPDEYDDLIDPILRELARRPSVDRLAAELRGVVVTDYGLPTPHGCRKTARALLDVATAPAL